MKKLLGEHVISYSETTLLRRELNYSSYELFLHPKSRPFSSPAELPSTWDI
jgi:hypothetical protein